MPKFKYTPEQRAAAFVLSQAGMKSQSVAALTGVQAAMVRMIKSNRIKIMQWELNGPRARETAVLLRKIADKLESSNQAA